MTAPKPLTRKLGPLPVYAWALALIGAYLVYRRLHAGSGGSSQATPVLPAARSDAQQPSGGQGTPADNMSNDLLSAFGDRQSSYDALLSALQGGGGYGTTSGSGSGGSGSSSGTATAALGSETIDSGTDNAPTETIITEPAGPPEPTAPAPTDYTAPSYQQPGQILQPGTAFIATNDDPMGGGTTSVSSPPPIEVAPAPVDTSTTYSSAIIAPSRLAAV